MKLKIWEDGEGARHTLLDGVEISGILTGLTLINKPHYPPLVELEIIPSCVELVVEAEVEVVIGGKKYRLKE